MTLPILEDCKPFIEAFEQIFKIKESRRWEIATNDELLSRFDYLGDALEEIIGEFREKAEREARSLLMWDTDERDRLNRALHEPELAIEEIIGEFREKEDGKAGL